MQDPHLQNLGILWAGGNWLIEVDPNNSERCQLAVHRSQDECLHSPNGCVRERTVTSSTRKLQPF